MATPSFKITFNQATGHFTAQDTTDWAGQGITAADVVANLQIIAPNGSIHYQNGYPLGTFETGTAQSGSTSTIRLASGASSTTNFYKNLLCLITGGAASGQKPVVTAYDGATKIATAAFTVATNNTSTYKFCFNDIFFFLWKD